MKRNLIKVKDKLPKVGRDVICFYKSDKYVIPKRCSLKKDKDKFVWVTFDGHGISNVNDVKFWMKIPRF